MSKLKPFTGDEASILALFAQYPKLNESSRPIMNNLTGHALKVAKSLVGDAPITDDVKETVEWLQAWASKLPKR